MAGNHGGARRGAGRKPGSGNAAVANNKAREELLAQVPDLSERVKATLPLQRIELLAMIYHQKFEDAAAAGEPDAIRWLELAAKWSLDSANFFHPKRSNINVTDDRDVAEPKTLEDLKASVFGSAPTPKLKPDGLH